MITVNAPDGSTVTFPDGTAESKINEVMTQRFAPQAENSLAGSAKAVGSGLVEGAIGLAGLPADAIDLATRGIDTLAGTHANEAVSPFTSKLGSQNIKRTVESYTGELPKPQTTFEKYLHTTAEFAPAALAGPGGIARRVATQVIAPGVASEAAGQLTEGTALEPVARVAGALTGAAGAGSALRATERRAAIPAAPTPQELDQAVSAGYNSPAVKALEIDPNAVGKVTDRIVANLKRDRFSEKNAPKTYDAIEGLRTPEFGTNHTLADFDATRRILNKIAADPSTEGEAARRAIRSIDAFSLRVPKSAVVAGDASAAAADLASARANAAAQFRDKRIGDAVERATNTAMATHSGGNMENELRKQVRNMLNNPKQLRGFSADEKEAMRQFVRGGRIQNVTRRLGKLLGGGGGLGQLASGGTGAAMFGLPGALGLPAIGLAANKIGTALSEKQLEQLRELIRARSPLYGPANQAARQAALSTSMLSGLPSPQQAALSALIAARLQSPEYARQ